MSNHITSTPPVSVGTFLHSISRELHEATQFLSSTQQTTTTTTIRRHQQPIISVNNILHTLPPLKLARINLDNNTTYQGADTDSGVARISSLVDKKKSVGKETAAPQSNHHCMDDDADEEEEEEEEEGDPIDRLRAVSEGLRRLRCDLESRLEEQCCSNNG